LCISPHLRTCQMHHPLTYLICSFSIHEKRQNIFIPILKCYGFSVADFPSCSPNFILGCCSRGSVSWLETSELTATTSSYSHLFLSASVPLISHLSMNFFSYKTEHTNPQQLIIFQTLSKCYKLLYKFKV
jgi:hypothetical protein